MSLWVIGCCQLCVECGVKCSYVSVITLRIVFEVANVVPYNILYGINAVTDSVVLASFR